MDGMVEREGLLSEGRSKRSEEAQVEQLVIVYCHGFNIHPLSTQQNDFCVDGTGGIFENIQYRKQFPSCLWGSGGLKMSFP